MRRVNQDKTESKFNFRAVTCVHELEFFNQAQGTARFNISNSFLREGENVVRLTSLAGGSDISIVDYVRISYPHRYVADNNLLRLTVPGGQQIKIDGFTSSSIRVFDVTDSNMPEELLGETQQTLSGYSIRFASEREGNRRLIAIGDDPLAATICGSYQHSHLDKTGADFIIITRRELSSALEPLVALRNSQGLNVAVVDVEDIYDEFSFGQKTPYAVRNFLALAKRQWQEKPRFILFAADASYDPKNYLGFGDSDLVPTKLIDTRQMETCSDDWFSDFDGDGLADIATGRLPARTSDELARMISKTISYEQGSRADETLLVADATDGFDFEQSSIELISLVPASLKITQVNRGRTDPETAKKSLLEGIYRRQCLVNYAGHGSVDLWRGNLLTNEDALGLRNDHLPMFVMMTCLNGYFDDPVLDSLGESLMKADGGAVAVWASSGMTVPDEQAAIDKELYRLLFNRSITMTIGEAARGAKLASRDSDVRRTWILLGDPTMKLR